MLIGHDTPDRDRGRLHSLIDSLQVSYLGYSCWWWSWRTYIASLTAHTASPPSHSKLDFQVSYLFFQGDHDHESSWRTSYYLRGNPDHKTGRRHVEKTGMLQLQPIKVPGCSLQLHMIQSRSLFMYFAQLRQMNIFLETSSNAAIES